jgi:hypothetical protein
MASILGTFVFVHFVFSFLLFSCQHTYKHTHIHFVACRRYTGEVRKIETENIMKRLEQGDVVLLTTLGYSASGQTFNVVSEHLASETAAALQANKLLFITEGQTLVDTRTGHVIQSMRVGGKLMCICLCFVLCASGCEDVWWTETFFSSNHPTPHAYTQKCQNPHTHTHIHTYKHTAQRCQGPARAP